MLTVISKAKNVKRVLPHFSSQNSHLVLSKMVV